MARKENAFIISLCVIFVLEDTQQLVDDIFISESEWHQVISNIAHSLWDPTRANTVIMLCCSSLMTHTIFILSKRFECQPQRFLSSHAQLIISIQILVLHQTKRSNRMSPAMHFDKTCSTKSTNYALRRWRSLDILTASGKSKRSRSINVFFIHFLNSSITSVRMAAIFF